MKIGVIGLGTVGYGVIEILTNEKTRLEKEMKQEIVVKYGCGLEEVDLPKEIIYTKDYHDVINYGGNNNCEKHYLRSIK